MRRFVIILTLLFALFAFINAISAGPPGEDSSRGAETGLSFFR
jgi:hypothetical protein